jgi:hypothetical protein
MAQPSQYHTARASQPSYRAQCTRAWPVATSSATSMRMGAESEMPQNGTSSSGTAM